MPEGWKQSIHEISAQEFINQYNKSLREMISLNGNLVKMEKIIGQNSLSSIVEKKTTWKSEKANS